MANDKQYHYGRQTLTDEDMASVVEVLQSDFLSQGPKLAEFEAKVAHYCGAEYCVAVSNGTTALHLAVAAMGVSQNDIGWTTPLTFVATPNSIRYVGAEVDFVDIDGDTFNMSTTLLAQKCEEAEKYGKLPKVLIPVHFTGQSCDMEEIKRIADRYDCKVIEDACQAMGGEYQGDKIGCSRFSDATVFSLHPVKSITAGEGGLVLTNNKNLYDEIRIMRAHGIVKGDQVVDKTVGPWHVEMQQEGYNYKITDFQCALGISQMDKLDAFIEKRRVLANRYRELLKHLPLSVQAVNKPQESAWHLFIIRINFSNTQLSKVDFFQQMKARNIHLSVHYNPIHKNPFYQDYGFKGVSFAEVERYYSQAFTLPLHPGLELDDIEYIAEQIRAILVR